MPVHPETLRRVMRHWTTGVTIVCAAHNGHRHGMTVTSFTSISLEPPLVLVSLEHGTRTLELVKQAGTFSVCLLQQGQEGISDRFGGRETEDTDRFAGLDTDVELTGAPILKDCMAYLDCRVVGQHEAGNHTLIIGEVLEAAGEERGDPLVYFNRNYRRLV